MRDKLLFSAPMAGVTDKPFRLMMRQFTSRPLYTEMIGIRTLYHNHYLTRKMLHISDERDIIVQLVGVEPEYMIHGAKEALFYGAKGIDINMGCPVKKLISNGSGAKLMQNQELACRLVECVKKEVTVPVSVKTRIGWDDTDINVTQFAKALENAGADRITIHGRTKAQGYAGQVNQSAIAMAKEALHIPVIANGDVVDIASAQAMLKSTQADGLMVGRGLLGRPWLLALLDGKQVPRLDLSDVVLKHLDLMLSYYGNHGLLVARKHIAWYTQGLQGRTTFLNQMYQEKDIATVQKLVREFMSGYQINHLIGGKGE